MFWQIYQKLMLSGFLSSRNLRLIHYLKLFWPHAPWQEGCHILVKNLIFDDPFHKKLSVLVILVPVMIRKRLGGIGLLRPVRLQRLLRFLRPGKSLLWTSVFQVLEFNNSRTWILAPFLSEAVEAAWGQKSFKWLIRHKFPLLSNPLSINFW